MRGPLIRDDEPRSAGSEPARRLVLVGGGHAHVQVLRRFAMEPPQGAHVTVVLDVPVAVYSGMVPGHVAGRYAAHELEIDIVPLARRAGAAVVLHACTGVDPVARRILLDGRPPLAYDVASFDIGSTVAGLDLPGVAERAVSSRPIGRFVRRLGEVDRALRWRLESGAADGRPFDVVVVGAGAGGVEVAFAMRRRLDALAREHAGADASARAEVRVRLLQAGPRILPGSPERLARRIVAEAAARDIEIRTGAEVAAADDGAVVLEGGERLPCDALLWVTGAGPHGLLRDAGLPTDERGFVRVRPTLQVEGHDDLFAVGDCASLITHPRTPKAGVYAVRQGPTLIDNLRAMLDAPPGPQSPQSLHSLHSPRLRRYRPQKDFLALLNLGDGHAVGSKWGLVFGGRWVMEWKDWIDRRFMRKFQVLDDAGALSDAFPAMDPMDTLCGGCAAKVGQSVLDRALGRVAATAGPARDASVLLGLDVPDDAAAVRTPSGDVVVSSVDAFKALTDDPWLVGRVAAVNAMSDLLAKGVAPRHALANLTLPEGLGDDAAEEMLFQILSGVRSALDEAGATLVGGHTTTASELVVGLAVSGWAEGELLSLDRLRPGQVLVLTKPLGTGVLFHADMAGKARGPWIEQAIRWMARSNHGAARCAADHGATAATDITGFGLVGHVGEMARASRVSVTLDVGALPALDGAVELLGRGERSTFHEENARARRGILVEDGAERDPRFELLFDPQTSGGLVFGVPVEQVQEVTRALRDAGDACAVVGLVRAAGDGPPGRLRVCVGLGRSGRQSTNGMRDRVQ